MKRILLALLAYLPLTLWAAPTLYSDPYSVDPPDLATMTVNGGLPVVGGAQPQCDLAALTIAGTYSLQMSVSRSGDAALGIPPATSVVFSYKVQLGSVATPIPALSGSFLLSQIYSAGTIDAGNLTINNGSPLSCPLVTVVGGVQLKCSLSSITTGGTYSLLMTVAKAGTITNVLNVSAVRTLAGVASSVPFSYQYRTSVAAPTLGVAP